MIPFGPYFLVQRLTVGGMAEVFLATRREDPEGPLVVVKRILPHLQARSDFVQMFLDEARLTSSLFHPNLVRVHDFGKAEGVHFIAMEYVDGLSLSLVLRRQPKRQLPMALGCWLVAEACAGLAYAHGRLDGQGRTLGIVHRDVSPDNILISQQGEVKLADFGIAKAKIQLTRTRPGQIKGKFAYMSPEQGMRLKIDHRSDIFSAGLVLYEVTTGKRVFPAGNEVETLRSLYERKYTPPEEVQPDYPPALAAIVNRALAWDPDKRFQQVEEMRQALLQLLPEGIDPARDLAVLVQCLREQMQLIRPRPAEQSTKQQSMNGIVPPPVAAGRDTLLGVGDQGEIEHSTDSRTRRISAVADVTTTDPERPCWSPVGDLGLPRSSVSGVLFGEEEMADWEEGADSVVDELEEGPTSPKLRRPAEQVPAADDDAVPLPRRADQADQTEQVADGDAVQLSPPPVGQDTEPMPALDFDEPQEPAPPPVAPSLADAPDTVRVPALFDEIEGPEDEED
jgi:serine/threonine protein kinase